MTILHFC